MTEPATSTYPEPEAGVVGSPDRAVPPPPPVDEAEPQTPEPVAPEPQTAPEPGPDPHPEPEPEPDERPQSEAEWRRANEIDDEARVGEHRGDFAPAPPTDRVNPITGQTERTFYDPLTGRPRATFVIAPDSRAFAVARPGPSPRSAGLQSAVYVHPIGSDDSELFERAARPGPDVRRPPEAPPSSTPGPLRPARRGPPPPRLRSLGQVGLEKRLMPVIYRGGLDRATHEIANAALDGGMKLLDAQFGSGRLTAREADALRALKSFAIAPGRSGQDKGWVRKFRVEPALQLERLLQTHH